MSRICLDLNVLRTFVAGVDLGSFAKAADRVGRSQSAVSSQLSKLNALAGKPVVRKAGRGLALTEAGEVTLSYARRLLDLNDEAVMAIQDAKLQGWVRFGLPQDFAENWLPEALGNFARAHLGVRVEVVAGRNAELLPRVGAGSLDLALAWGEPDGPHADRVAELPMVWIGPAKGAPLWDVGEAVPVIALDAPCRFRSAGTSALGAAGISWRLAFSSGSLSGSWAAVAAGLGVSPRTPVGLPPTVRVLKTGEFGLPALPKIGMSLYRSNAELLPVPERLANILIDTIARNIEQLAA